MTQPVSLLPRTTHQTSEEDGVAPFAGLYDVVLPVTIVLGTGTVTVKRCLALQPDSVLKLDQSAGEDLTLTINGVRVARGEVMIVEDSSAVRVTSVVKAAGRETSQS